jgi:hypothetical protein
MEKNYKNLDLKKTYWIKFYHKQILIRINKTCLKKLRNKLKKRMNYYKETDIIHINQIYLIEIDYKS